MLSSELSSVYWSHHSSRQVLISWGLNYSWGQNCHHCEWKQPLGHHFFQRLCHFLLSLVVSSLIELMMVHVQQERYNCLISKIVIYLPQASQTQILHFVLYHLHKSMSSVVKKDCVHFISSFCDKLLFRLSIGSFSVNTILLWASATKFKLFFCTQASTTKSNK